MKLLFIISNLRMGGAQRQLIELANYLRSQKNIEVFIISLQGGKDAVALLEKYRLPWKLIPCEVSHDPWLFIRKSLLQLIGFIIKVRYSFKPVVIYSFMESPNVCGALIWRLCGAKLFIWGQRNPGIFLRNSWLERLAVRYVPLFISNSPMGKSGIKKMYGIPDEKNHFIPNGILIKKPEHDISYWREKFSIGIDDFVVVMVANITRYKDHMTLVNAWALFLRSTPDMHAKLLLVGAKGTSWDLVQQKVEELSISDRVIFTDFIQDVSGLLRICSLAAFTQKDNNEGLPNGALECMAAGLAVVASNMESLRYILSEENKKYLCEPGNFVSHAEQISFFYNHPDLRCQIGKLNKDKVDREFTVTQMGERTWELIKEHCQK